MAKELKIHNNLTRKKETFEPIEPGKVKFYSCGPTTYDFLHIGNARALVVADLFHRVLKAFGYDVTFVRNYTDVDDKIIARAKEVNQNAIEFAAHWVDEVKTDMDSLGMKPATHTPKVSETMPEIIQMIQDIINNGSGYVVDGEVLFSVPSFPSYGKINTQDAFSPIFDIAGHHIKSTGYFLNQHFNGGNISRIDGTTKADIFHFSQERYPRGFALPRKFSRQQQSARLED